MNTLEMPLSSFFSEKTLCAGIIGASKVINTYKDKPDDVRFCLLLDKVRILMAGLSALTDDKTFLPLFCPSLMDEPELLKNTTDAIDVITKEFVELEKYLLRIRKSEYTEIIGRLDDVLLGPDYPQGKEMMERAKTDFVSRNEVGESESVETKVEQEPIPSSSTTSLPGPTTPSPLFRQIMNNLDSERRISRIPRYSE